MKFDDEIFLILCEVASLEVRPQIVYPSQPATLAATEQTGGLRKSSPATLAVLLNVIDELLVLLLGPRPLVGVPLVAARLPHGSLISVSLVVEAKASDMIFAVEGGGERERES